MPVANIVGQADNLLIDGQHPFWSGFQASGTPVGRISSSVQRASNILPLDIAGLAEGCCARTKNAVRMAASRRSMRSCPEVTIGLCSRRVFYTELAARRLPATRQARPGAPKVSSQGHQNVRLWPEAEVLTGRLCGRFRRVSGPVADMTEPALLTQLGHQTFRPPSAALAVPPIVRAC